MKKRLIYLSILPLLLLSSCGGGGGDNSSAITSSSENSSESLSSEQQSSELPSSEEASSSSKESSSEQKSEESSIITSSEQSSSEQSSEMEDDPAENYVFENNDNSQGSMSYEIFVRSFYDSDGNGIGDLNGVTYQLDYLKQMGFKTLWLTPIHPSPSYHGYDVSDYFAVHSELGTMDDFDNLVSEAKKRNIDIMLDMVFNHCSSKNPLFVDSYYDFIYENEDEDSKANWFTWSEASNTVCTNHYPNDSHAWYESRFDASMPDFNLDCQAVRDYIENVMKFWIEDHGVKGFRLDAVLYYYYNTTAKNTSFLTWLEETAHKYDPDFYMVGECWSSDAAINSYCTSKLDSFFRFEGSYEGGANSIANMAKGTASAKTFINKIVKNVSAIHEKNPNGYPSYFLSNHDMDRISNAFVGKDDAAKTAASILALLPGTSYMYYGEEIGLMGKRKTSPDDMSDARRRLPVIWSETDKDGECEFPERNRQDLKNNEQVTLGIYDRQNENFSLLNHYRKAIDVRNKYPFIKHADVVSLVENLNTTSTKVLAYKLYNGDDYIIVVHNCGNDDMQVTVDGTDIVDEINVNHKIPTLKDKLLSIGAHSTVVIK